jgi:uncharacterized membrane protein YdjX (TVP38/TMEM64 family)
LSDVLECDTPEPQPHTKRAWLLVAMLIAAAATIYFLWFTETGRRVFTRENAMQFAEERWLITPLVLVAIFVALSLMSLPSWWLQLLTGVCYGLWYGTFLSLVCCVIAAGVTTWFARWSAGDWFTARFESRMAKLRKLEAMVDRNALAAVLVLRITPFVPFGIANYMLGLFHVPIATVMIGTAIGAIPRIAFWVQWGIADPSEDPVVFWTIIGMNLAALSTIPLRYYKPDWFRKMGIE